MNYNYLPLNPAKIYVIVASSIINNRPCDYCDCGIIECNQKKKKKEIYDRYDRYAKSRYYNKLFAQ